ncbi:CpsD/CapB family tyrosine-protein kinase [Thermodesulfobacteriota bacterium]
MGRLHKALEKVNKETNKHFQDATPESKKDVSAIDPLSGSAATLLSESETTSLSEETSTLLPESKTAPLLESAVAPISGTETTTSFTPKPSHEYQAIKTKIITRFPDKAIKTIMVTGTSRQCGTSTTAVGFATTLASDCKSRVLLVEANTRLPSFYKFFDLKEGIGLSDLFSGSPENLLPFQTAVTSNLYVMPSGERKSGVNTFLESERFDAILEQFRNAFDYVILDAPPIISYDEPKVLGKKVDGVILVSQSGKSRQRVAIRAKNELEITGANILGVVLNRRKHYIPEWLYKRL